MLIAFAVTAMGCEDSDHSHSEDQESHGSQTEVQEEQVHLTGDQFNSLELRVDTMVLRNIGSYIEANGQLEVSPQNEASVTAIIGSNVTSIEVIEGDKVKKGQVLAYLTHPDLIELQSSYISTWSELQYAEQEYVRQENLFAADVNSAKNFQKAQSEFFALKGTVAGYETQLKILGLNVQRVQGGEISEQVAVTTPIDGYVRMVEIKTGQYVEPQTDMFEIVNNDHVHVDLMVFEKDIYQVQEGQSVTFTVESIPDQELSATIYSVGKAFEQDPKALHLHAEIENKSGLLIPGMYVKGRIMTGERYVNALPNEAIVNEQGEHFVFIANQDEENGELVWVFTPLKVRTGTSDNGWTEIRLLDGLGPETKFAWNNAYYLMADLKKGEAGHEH